MTTLTTVTITITSSGPSPNPVTVKPGYQVLFQMDWEAEVDVDFGTKSPFVSEVKKFSLDGAIQSLAHKTYTIADLEGSFGFNIVPLVRIDPEPPTLSPGDLEVTRDPPKEDEKK
jgi:hypothetical protein